MSKSDQFYCYFLSLLWSFWLCSSSSAGHESILLLDRLCQIHSIQFTWTYPQVPKFLHIPAYLDLSFIVRISSYTCLLGFTLDCQLFTHSHLDLRLAARLDKAQFIQQIQSPYLAKSCFHSKSIFSWLSLLSLFRRFSCCLQLHF